MRLAYRQVGLGVGPPVEHPQDHRPLRVRRYLRLVELAFVDQVLHQGVVMRDLHQLAIAQQVRPRVANVCEGKAIAAPQQGCQRRAHAVELVVGVHHVAELFIRRADRLFENAEQVGRRVVIVEGCQRRDRDGACYVAGRVPTHAVGDGH